MSKLSRIIKGSRVQVCSGGLEKYLGEGTFLGHVGMYYFEFPDYIKSASSGETFPKNSEIKNAYKNGGSLKYYKRMGKIRLDSGKILYGVDCWYGNEKKEDFLAWMKKKKKDNDSSVFTKILRDLRHEKLTYSQAYKKLRHNGYKPRTIHYWLTKEENGKLCVG